MVRRMPASAPWGAAGELAASRHGVLTRLQAADNEISAKVIRRLLRTGHVREPVPGVLIVAGAPDTWRQRVEVATLASRGAGIAGFRSTAALHGFDGYRPGPIELLVPSRRHIELPGLVLHRGPMDRRDLCIIDAIACTSIERTLCDLGAVDSPPKVRVAFESAWRNGCSLRKIRATAERMHRPGQRGTKLVLALLDEAALHRRSTESALELRVERALRGVAGVVRQHTVRSSSGRFVARVDFAIPELRIAIEAHSRQHHFGPQRESADATREVALLAQGWVVRYITDAQCREPHQLRESILSLIAARLANWGTSRPA
jgi:very-short-patch-repair endonuclease